MAGSSSNSSGGSDLLIVGGGDAAQAAPGIRRLAREVSWCATCLLRGGLESLTRCEDIDFVGPGMLQPMSVLGWCYRRVLLDIEE